MAEINDLNVTDASNTARFAENQAPSSLNDGARALEGILARWHKDNNGSLVSTGSSNAYALAANQTISAYYDGLTLTFETNFANTGAATLSVDSAGAQAIVWPDGSALSSGDLPSGAKVSVIYDNDNTQWMLVSRPKPGVIVSGTEQATTSGTNKDFTIPSWATEIRINFVGNSLNGAGNITIQLGDSGGVEATGYLGAGSSFSTSGQTVTNATSAFLILMGDATAVVHGSVVLSLEDSSNFTWVCSGHLSRSDSGVALFVSGSKSLSAALTTVRVTVSAGAWDAGAINITYQ